MNLEQAIRNALDYERRIRDIYEKAAGQAEDPVGKRVFAGLAADEQRHVDYLKSRLAQWSKARKISLENLEEAVPDRGWIREKSAPVEHQMAREDRKDEKQMLSKALQAEIETSAFYKKMIGALDGEGRRLFSRFYQIEQGHVDAVQAELDYLSGTGYWLGFKEFDME
ncbi:MAG: ferritin family protein [Desulfobacterales bacterium]|nr:ferritin family protein [Desulfobacterales bacterium]